VLNCRTENQTHIHTIISRTAKQSSLSMGRDGGRSKSKGRSTEQRKEQSKGRRGMKSKQGEKKR